MHSEYLEKSSEYRAVSGAKSEEGMSVCYFSNLKDNDLHHGMLAPHPGIVM